MTTDQLQATEDEQVLRALALLAPPTESAAPMTFDTDGGAIAKSPPPCVMPSRLFKIDVTVR